MKSEKPRYIKEDESKAPRFISVDTPPIRGGGEGDEHGQNGSRLLKWCVILLIPICVLLFFYTLIDNPRGPLLDQGPSVAYRGEMETDRLEFYFVGNLHKSYFYDNQVRLEFYIDTASTSPAYYGYLPSASINRAIDGGKADNHGDTSYFVINANEVYKQRASDFDDAVLYDVIQRPMERGKKYIVKIKGRHKGIIFRRPERVRVCSFTLEDKKSVAVVTSAGNNRRVNDTPTATPGNSQNKPAANNKAETQSNEENLVTSKSTSTLAKTNNATSSASTPLAVSSEAGHEYVDLGIGTKWATCNIGSSISSDGGSWYAWGETKPKTSSSWSNYNLRSRGDDINSVIFTKYNTNEQWGPVDNKSRLDLTEDAARQTWGGRWRIPTKAEWEELINRCSWSWTKENGKTGYKVTGTNGNSIFLPTEAGELGIYWSANLKQDEPPRAWSFVILSGNYYMYGNYSRTNQNMIRPVF